MHDTAMRRLVAAAPEAMCRLLGVESTGPPRRLPGDFPASTVYVDALLRTASRQLVQVEYQHAAAGDLADRMLHYLAAIRRAFPGDRVTQYVIILGRGVVRGFDDVVGRGYALDLRVVYLRDLEPEVFLGSVELAPLAVLARGGRVQRARALAAAARLIVAEGGGRVPELLEFLLTLATIRLDPGTIVQTVNEEVDMTVESLADAFEKSNFGRTLARRGHDQGLEQGVEQGRAKVLAALLRVRFGDQPQVAEIAARLATWDDADAATHAVTDAADLASVPLTPPVP